MKLKKDADIPEFMNVVRDSCRGDGYYESRDANIDLKSELSRFVFMTVVNDAGSNVQGRVYCTDENDYKVLGGFLTE